MNHLTICHGTIRRLGGVIAAVSLCLLVSACHVKPVAAPPATKPPDATRRAESPKPRKEQFAGFFGPLAKSYGRHDSVDFWLQNRSNQTAWFECIPEMRSKGGWGTAVDIDSARYIDAGDPVKVPPFSKKRVVWRFEGNLDFFWDENPRRCRILVAVLHFRGRNWPPPSTEGGALLDIYSPAVTVNLES